MMRIRKLTIPSSSSLLYNPLIVELCHLATIATIQVPFSRRLRRPWKKKGILRGHPAPRQGDAVPLHPLLNGYNYSGAHFEPPSAVSKEGSEDTPRHGRGHEVPPPPLRIIYD